MRHTTISANSLFHFTNSLDNLLSILRNNFYPRYCLEDRSMFLSEGHSYQQVAEHALPMVCFCDIPLSQIRDHIETYGGYAIGLSKDWAKKKKINPVKYHHPNSYSTEILRKSYEILLEYYPDFDEFLELFNMDSLDSNSKMKTLGVYLDYFLDYAKPYEGKVWRNGKYSDKEVRFYDEREWRFVPDVNIFARHKLHPGMKREDFLDENLRKLYNERLQKICKLDFAPNDIKYLIVYKESEVLTMVEKIKEIKNKFSQEEITLLITRIISLDQIIEDF